MKINLNVIYCIALTLCLSTHVWGQAESQIVCAGQEIKMYSYCSVDKANEIACEKQIISFPSNAHNKKISRTLNKRIIEFTPATKWECSLGSTDIKFIQIWYCQDVNCDIGMDLRFELWDTTGNLRVKAGRDMGYITKKHNLSFPAGEPAKINLIKQK